MTTLDEDTGIIHTIYSWNQYSEAVRRARAKAPHAKRGYGSLELTVETLCGLTVRSVGAFMKPATCIGCLACT